MPVCVCVYSYTLVFLHYAFSLLSLLVCRPLISVKLTDHGGTKSIYAALYFLPILVCGHAVFAGFICTYRCTLSLSVCLSILTIIFQDNPGKPIQNVSILDLI